MRSAPRLRGEERCEYGWRLGTSHQPHGVPLWVPFDRTTGVFGVQGSGKTLDLLFPALLAHRGAALVTLTKPEDLYLTLRARQRPMQAGDAERPVVVLDPYGITPGTPELVFDPIAGCVDSETAERRAAAFAAGTVQQAAVNSGDGAARFYCDEATKVLQCYFHAAALTGRSLDDVLAWVASPRTSRLPETILVEHPHAAQHWAGLLHDALHGDHKTSSNTITTVQQAMKLFFQPAYRSRCVPSPGRPATDIAAVIRGGGTIYLLGREDKLISASPLMTAVAEHVLDTAKQLAMQSPYGRLCPPFLALLDELPSTAPIPTLAQRMANERALGLTFIYATQTWRQMVMQYGEDAAWALFGLTNTAVVFGRGKDMRLYEEMSKLIGDIHVERLSHSSGASGSSRTRSVEQTPVLPPADIRRIPDRQALVIADEAAPIIAKLIRCIDGKPGRQLLDDQTGLRADIDKHRAALPPVDARSEHAQAWAHANGYGPGNDPTGALVAARADYEPTAPSAAAAAEEMW